MMAVHELVCLVHLCMQAPLQTLQVELNNYLSLLKSKVRAVGLVRPRCPACYSIEGPCAATLNAGLMQAAPQCRPALCLPRFAEVHARLVSHCSHGYSEPTVAACLQWLTTGNQRRQHAGCLRCLCARRTMPVHDMHACATVYARISQW